MDIDTDRVDDAVLALLLLGLPPWGTADANGLAGGAPGSRSTGMLSTGCTPRV
jgi:hypothetical protein